MEKEKSVKKGFVNKFLDFIEVGGNKLPHPVTLFFLFCVAIILISGIAAKIGLSVTYEALNKTTGNFEETTIKVKSLMTGDGVRYIFNSMIKNFTGFAPLGTVLIGVIGIGVCEGSGLMSALIKKIVTSTPKRAITAVVVFAGVMSNIASDAGYVVLVPLGAVIFLSFGRHPLAGLAAAFAGVSGGFSANLLLGTTDPLLGGITTEAARLLDHNYFVDATANYYFMFVSTFLITASQFIAYFGYTNLGTVIAVSGASALKSIGFTGLPLIVAFVFLTGFINLFMGSASAKWAIMAPVFVPMLMQLGYTPEFTQLAYRIGDSSTNIISPLMSYFAMAVAFMQKYKKDGGMGTLISLMLPYSICFLIGWTMLMIVWFLIGLPIGPGISIHL